MAITPSDLKFFRRTDMPDDIGDSESEVLLRLGGDTVAESMQSLAESFKGLGAATVAAATAGTAFGKAMSHMARADRGTGLAQTRKVYAQSGGRLVPPPWIAMERNEYTRSMMYRCERCGWRWRLDDDLVQDLSHGEIASMRKHMIEHECVSEERASVCSEEVVILSPILEKKKDPNIRFIRFGKK